MAIARRSLCSLPSLKLQQQLVVVLVVLLLVFVVVVVVTLRELSNLSQVEFDTHRTLCAFFCIFFLIPRRQAKRSLNIFNWTFASRQRATWTETDSQTLRQTDRPTTTKTTTNINFVSTMLKTTKRGKNRKGRAESSVLVCSLGLGSGSCGYWLDRYQGVETMHDVSLPLLFTLSLTLLCCIQLAL